MAKSEYDPTRTLTLRNRFVQRLKGRFNILVKLINEAVVTNDVFGITNPPMLLAAPLPEAYAFLTNAEKVEEFLRWMDEMVEQGLFQVYDHRGVPVTSLANMPRKSWMDTYIFSAYQAGIRQAQKELRKAGMKIPDVSVREAILNTPTSFGVEAHIQRVETLYTRTFDELKGVTKDMADDMSRVLSKGLVEGKNASTVAKELNSVITGKGKTLEMKDTLGRRLSSQYRAEMIARTELIRAHHLGNIQELKNFGIKTVDVIAEWSTAKDKRVCARCDQMADKGPYVLKDVEGLIPLHPMCRCMVVPRWDLSPSLTKTLKL